MARSMSQVLDVRDMMKLVSSTLGWEILYQHSLTATSWQLIWGGLTAFLQFLQFKDLKEAGEGKEFDPCQAGKEEGKELVEESRDGHQRKWSLLYLSKGTTT